MLASIPVKLCPGIFTTLFIKQAWANRLMLLQKTKSSGDYHNSVIYMIKLEIFITSVLAKMIVCVFRIPFTRARYCLQKIETVNYIVGSGTTYQFAHTISKRVFKPNAYDFLHSKKKWGFTTRF